MIDSLISLYHVLEAAGTIPEYGFSMVNVPYGLQLDDDGRLIGLTAFADGDHHVMPVPARVVRSRDVKPNFACDTIQYLLADPAKNEKRAKDCYKASGILHGKVLADVDTPAAKAVKRFFALPPQWRRLRGMVDDDVYEELPRANMILCHGGVPVTMDALIASAWQSDYGTDSQSGPQFTSLASCEPVTPTRIHPRIKGVKGAPSTGVALVSFKGDSLNSHGHEQRLNAPVSDREAYEYSTALNTLLSDPASTLTIGEVSLVCWTESGYPEYAQLFLAHMEPQRAYDLNIDAGELLNRIMHDTTCIMHGRILDPDERFHVLALSPNMARLTVRFHVTAPYRLFVENLIQHYRDTDIIPFPGKPSRLQTARIILSSTISPNRHDAIPAPEVTGETLRSILTGNPLPRSLFELTRMRILAERGVNTTRAAILRAWGLQAERRGLGTLPRGILGRDLNTQTDYPPYVLGRIFALYSKFDWSVKPSRANRTRWDYLTAAQTRPSHVFPILDAMPMPRSRSFTPLQHATLNATRNSIGLLYDRLDHRLPETLNVDEQTAFQLGYYFENSTRRSDYTGEGHDPKEQHDGTDPASV